MQLTRFEYRLLRFFNDNCLPFFTLDVRYAEHVWHGMFPRYFASLNIVRHATFAFACLNLWPLTNLNAALDADNAMAAVDTTPLEWDEALGFSHVFKSVSVFDESNSSIFLQTTSYFINALHDSTNHAAHLMLQNDPSFHEMSILYFTGFLVLSFVSIHPHNIVPLVDFDALCPSDMLLLSMSVSRVFRSIPEDLRFSIIESYNSYTLQTPAPLEKIPFIEHMRRQINDHYFASTSFLEIDSRICEEHATLEAAILMLEGTFYSSITNNIPGPLFKTLVLLPPEFIHLARTKNFFALQLLFVYSCICLQCHLYMSRAENLWFRYVKQYAEMHEPMCAFNSALYNHVMNSKDVSFNRAFAQILRHFQDVADSAIE